MKRRNFLLKSALGVLASQALPFQANEKRSKRSARFIHLTDMHIFPDAVPERGIKHLMTDIHSMKDKPDFVINTGDNIMDSLKRTKEETAKQWDAWHIYYRSQLKYDLYSCIGNHDVWGWSMNDSKLESDPLFGKNWAVKELGIPNRYYSTDLKGWHFIFLDSPYWDKENHGYIAKLDKEQFEWFKTDLKQTGKETPVCIVSHIPILSASVFFDGDNEKDGDWRIPASWMHIDAREIKDVLVEYPNVKLAISGHIHLADKTNYLGVDYLCNGAACGAWWKGNYHEFPPLYAVIDLYDDGSFEAELVHYDWK